MDLLWVQQNTSVQENSLVYALNQNKTPAAVIDMGIGMNYTSAFAEQLTDGIFCLLKKMGMWSGAAIEPRKPVYSDQESDMTMLVSKTAGFFVRKVECGTRVQKGDLLGEIINPLEGKVLVQIKAPRPGLLFTMREYPICLRRGAHARKRIPAAVHRRSFGEPFKGNRKRGRTCGRP